MIANLASPRIATGSLAAVLSLAVLAAPAVRAQSTLVAIAADMSGITEGEAASWSVTRSGSATGNIDVTIAWSGSAEEGTDFTGVFSVMIPDGDPSVALNVSTSSDGDFEGCEMIIASISGVSGANALIGTPARAPIALYDNNVTPGGNENLEQSIVGVPGVGGVPRDIVVFDPDAGYRSRVQGDPVDLVYHYFGPGDQATFSDGRPDDDFAFDLDGGSNPPLAPATGFSLELDLIPQSGDLSGTAMIWEIGDTGSGASVLLLDGIPHLLVKCGGTSDDAPTDDGTVPGAFRDLDWGTPNASGNGTDDTVVIPLTATPLVAGLPARIGLVFDITGDSVSSSVNGAPPATATLLNRDSIDWHGDHGVAHGRADGDIGGSNSVAGSPFDGSTGLISDLSNGFSSIHCVRFYNGSSGTIDVSPGSPQAITATLTIQSGASAGAIQPTPGTFADLGGGVFQVSGHVPAVNAALASATFADSGTAFYPVVIAVQIQDAAGATATGDIVILSAAQSLIFVDDDFGGAPLAPIPDADGGSGVSPANFKFNAFTNFSDALAVIASGGIVVANDGTYPENLVLPNATILLGVTDSAGGVHIDSLTSGATDGIEIRSPNVLTVGSGGSTTTLAGVIFGTGGLTKAGTGTLILTNTNGTLGGLTGTTTINEGILRLGNGLSLGALDGDGPIVVNAPAELQFRPPIDTTLSQTGVLSGDGIVSAQGDGTLIFDNPGANTFSGGFNLGDGGVSSFDGVDQGTKDGFVVITNAGHLGTGTITARGSQLQTGIFGLIIPNAVEVADGGLCTGGGNSFALDGPVKLLATDRTFGNYGIAPTPVTVLVNGPIDLSEGGISVDGSEGKDNGQWSFRGNISGTAGGIDIQPNFDLGAVFLGGAANTYTGPTTVRTGTLLMDATHTGGGPFTIFDGASMDGSGSTDAPVTVNAGGTLTPGFGFTRILNTGDLTVRGTLRFGVVNTAAAPGAGYNQLVVTGSIDVSTATLDLAQGGTEKFPQHVTLIVNDGGDPVLPAFAGLPEGAFAAVPFQNSAFGAVISYAGDTGNDVVLTIVDPLDLDGDFILSFLEEAFDTNPNDRTSGREGLPVVSRSPDGSLVSIRWRQLNAPGARTYTPQLSTDGARTWSTAPGTPGISADQSNATPDATIWELSIGTGSSPHLAHLRLLVEG